MLPYPGRLERQGKTGKEIFRAPLPRAPSRSEIPSAATPTRGGRHTVDAVDARSESRLQRLYMMAACFADYACHGP